MGQFCHHHSGKTRTMALFWLRMSYHAQRYMFQHYMLRSLLTQSFNIVNTPVILLFSKKWVPGFAAEDNTCYASRHYAIQLGGLSWRRGLRESMIQCKQKGSAQFIKLIIITGYPVIIKFNEPCELQDQDR